MPPKKVDFIKLMSRAAQVTHSPQGQAIIGKLPKEDSLYGKIRFIRNLGAVPQMTDNGLALGKQDGLLTNFTLDLPFRLHEHYPHIPGENFLMVDPRAFRGKRFLSIHPSDSFLLTGDDIVDPRYVHFISGNEDALNDALKLGMNPITSQKLIDIFNIGRDAAQMEFDLGYNGGVRPIGNWDSNDLPYRVFGIGARPLKLSQAYREEADRIVKRVGRGSYKDYKTLEDITGLDSGVTSEFDPKFIEHVIEPGISKESFKPGVYYNMTSPIEDTLGLSWRSNYGSFDNWLYARQLLRDLNSMPLKKNGGVLKKYQLGGKGVAIIKPIIQSLPRFNQTDTMIGKMFLEKQLTGIPDIEKVLGHGIKGLDPMKQLTTLLNNGINPNKTFYTAPLWVDPELKAGLGAALGTSGGTCFTDVPFVAIPEGNKIKTVLVNDVENIVPGGFIQQLKISFPNVEFVPYSGARSYFLNKQGLLGFDYDLKNWLKPLETPQPLNLQKVELPEILDENGLPLPPPEVNHIL